MVSKDYLKLDETGTIVIGCDKNVTHIEIPEGVTGIGSKAFSFCESLHSIYIPSSVQSIGEGAFEYCIDLLSIEIPKGVSNIANGTFSFCFSLKFIEIPSDVIKIGDYAFSYCESLTTIEIPNSVTNLGESAFSDCHSLSSIEIPSSLTTIGNTPFEGCSSLQQIIVSSENQFYKSVDGIFYNKNIDTLISYPAKHTTNSFSIPDTVNMIASHAFYGCKYLSSIEIPNSVKKIGECAFEGCETLTSINLPNALKKLEKKTFSGCESLTTIYLPSCIEEIGEDVFRHCIKLKKINIPKNIQIISGNIFERCVIDNISSESDLFEIHNGGLYYNRKDGYKELISVFTDKTTFDILPETKKIGFAAFSHCFALHSVSIPDGVEEIGACAFGACCSIEKIEVPNSVTIIGHSAFSGCKKLQHLILGSVKVLEAYVMDDTALKYLIIPRTVQQVRTCAILNCKQLEDIYFEGKPSIHTNFIGNCDNIKSIYVPMYSTNYFRSQLPSYLSNKVRYNYMIMSNGKRYFIRKYYDNYVIGELSISVDKYNKSIGLNEIIYRPTGICYQTSGTSFDIFDDSCFLFGNFSSLYGKFYNDGRKLVEDIINLIKKLPKRQMIKTVGSTYFKYNECNFYLCKINRVYDGGSVSAESITSRYNWQQPLLKYYKTGTYATLGKDFNDSYYMESALYEFVKARLFQSKMFASQILEELYTKKGWKNDI